MIAYTESEFRKLELSQRYKVLKEQGEYIGGRIFGSHWVYLYVLSGFFVEMWVIIAVEEIQWIEIQSNQSILNEYTKNIDIKKDLNL
ncbi:MAG: hypothetical protein H3C31_12820 [Brumimicrobium sp.]|nr:hypothetical protein [Brumimicrobium sp.]